MVSPEALEEILEDGAHGRRRGPRHVFTGANQLRPSLRRRAEEIFGASVTDFYGTTECNLIAWECRRCGRYHTVDDSVIVEVIREDGRAAAPGEEGEVLLTALHSFAMPFLRFRIGDLARRPAEPPRCAIHFGALERIEGRVVDYLRFPDGGRLGPFALLDAVDSLHGLGRWQAVQHTETRIELRFEALPGAAEDALGAAIEANCRGILPAEVELEVRAVRSFPAATGGDGSAVRAKHRFVRSMVG
jgi:phenylacetate-CoA ligase